MHHAFIAIGSNIDPAANVREALRQLSRMTRLVGISTVYLSEPFGRPEQSKFYNAVAEIETELSPPELKDDVLRTIESELGRVRTEDKYAPRTIDLDTIVYDGELVDPEVADREFLAVPLYELAPNLDGIDEIAKHHNAHNMTPLVGYTAGIRKELEDELRKSAGAR